MDAHQFIRERYDWSCEDLERWSDAMVALPYADFNNVIDLMESFAEFKQKTSYNEVFEWLASKDYLSDKVETIQKEFEDFKNKNK